MNKFTPEQLEFLNEWLAQARAFLKQEPNHPLATSDVVAIEDALDGEFTPAFRIFLETSIEQMESSPIWAVNSQYQIAAMRSILAVTKGLTDEK